MGNTIQHMLTRDVLAILYFVTSGVMLLLAWFVIRAEILANQSRIPWKPYPPSLGWWMGLVFVCLFLLFFAIGFGVLFSPRPVYWWGSSITLILFVGSVGLFVSFARSEQDTWER